MSGASEQARAQGVNKSKDVFFTESARKINEPGISALKGLWQEITQQPYWRDFIASRNQPLRATIVGMGQRIEELIALQRILGSAKVLVVDNNEEALVAAQEKWEEYQSVDPAIKKMQVELNSMDLASIQEQKEKADLLIAHNMHPTLPKVLFEGGIPKIVQEGGLVVMTLARPMDVGLINLRLAWFNNRPHLAHWMQQVELVDERQIHGYEPNDPHALVKAFGSAWSDAALRVFTVTSPVVKT